MSRNPRINGSIGGHTSWSHTTDRPARTAPARQGFQQKFEREVDPDGTLDATTRAQMAESAFKAHMARMALASVKAREAKAREAKAKAKPEQGGSDVS